MKEGGLRGVTKAEKAQIKLLRFAAKAVDSKLRIRVMSNNVFPNDPEVSLRMDSGPTTGCRIFWIKAGVLQQDDPIPYRPPESFESMEAYFKHATNPEPPRSAYFDLSSEKDVAAWVKTLPRLLRMNELLGERGN